MKEEIKILIAGGSLLVASLGLYYSLRKKKSLSPGNVTVNVTGGGSPPGSVPGLPGLSPGTVTGASAGRPLPTRANPFALPSPVSQSATYKPPGGGSYIAPTLEQSQVKQGLAAPVGALAGGTGTLAQNAGGVAVMGAAQALGDVGQQARQTGASTALANAFGSPAGSIGFQRSGAGQGLAGALGELTGVGAGIGTFATSAFGGIRGKSEAQQTATWGKAATDTLGSLFNVIPGFGFIATPLLNLGAGTYEGARAQKAAGVAIEQGYNFQKKALAGDVSAAFSGGGTSHTQRLMQAAASQHADVVALGRGQSSEQARNQALIEKTSGSGTAWQAAQAKVAATNAANLAAVKGDASKLSKTQYAAAFGDAQTNANRAASSKMLADLSAKQMAASRATSGGF